MASTPATGAIGVELQAAGENLNTWGDPKLNNALQVLVNLSHGWKAWTINGTYTVSETNYATNNDTENAFIKLVAGTVTAAFNVVYPGRAKRHIVWNATAYTATLKLAATSGFSLPAGAFAIVATDGVTDVYNVGPTHAGTTTQATDSNAYALWGAVQTAIATAGLPATAGTILMSGADASAGYGAAKIIGTTAGGVAFDLVNPGANEKISGRLDFSSMTAETAPADADSVALYDASAGAHRKMTLANLLLSGWPSLTDVRDLDSILLYDASAAALKKALLADVVRRQNASSRFFATA